MLITNSFPSNVFVWSVPLADVGNTFKANVIVTDSATTSVTVNSVYSSTVTITSPYTPLTTPTLTLSNTLIDQGQSILFTAATTLGTSPYTYNYLVIAFNSQTSSNQIIANMLFTANSFTSNSWLWTPSGNLYVGNTMFEANV